ncbi:hypothetical protein ACYSUO_10165 [Streptomyces sp. UC4497]
MTAMALQTEYPFALPKGYVDPDGTLHRSGVMRLATAADEILPHKDPRVRANPSYLVVILLARVINSLGDLTDINTRVVEGFFAADLSYLQELYNRINGDGTHKVTCPHCERSFEVEETAAGES